MKRPIWQSAVTMLCLALAMNPHQLPPCDDGHGPGPRPGGPGFHGSPPPMRPSRSPIEHMLYNGASGRWWSDPWVAQRIGLTPDQQKRMDTLFQQSRLNLIDLSAALNKAEAVLEPMLDPDHPNEPRILLQIDRIAQARAELEKANARFLLALRAVLTPDQWKRLEAARSEPRHDDRR